MINQSPRKNAAGPSGDRTRGLLNTSRMRIRLCCRGWLNSVLKIRSFIVKHNMIIMFTVYGYNKSSSISSAFFGSVINTTVCTLYSSVTRHISYIYFFWILPFNFFFVYVFLELSNLQSNLNSSNTDGSFTTANSNSCLSPYEILPIAQEIKYLGIFFIL